MTMRKLLEYGGLLAGVVLIAFGIGALWLSFDARSTVQDELAREQIVGGDDMSPAGIQPGIDEAGLDAWLPRERRLRRSSRRWSRRPGNSSQLISQQLTASTPKT